MPGEVILEVKHLNKHFKVNSGFLGLQREWLKAVNDVSFSLRAGETLGIVGESGCGKSTLGNCIIRLLRPTSGEVRFQGMDICAMTDARLREHRKEIQMIFQDPFSSLNPRKRVFDIIAEPFRVHGTARGKALEEEVLGLMGEVGLDRSYAHRYPHEFSGGQRQRIGIARALALRPKLVICDEPVSALDVSIQAQILNLLKELQAKHHLTYIFIAHGLPSVRQISDHIAVMYLGEIVEMAPKNELFARTMHPYTVGLFEAIPVPDPGKRKEKQLLQGDIPNALHPPTGCCFHTRCPHADEVCVREKPRLTDMGGGHFLACHHPRRGSYGQAGEDQAGAGQAGEVVPGVGGGDVHGADVGALGTGGDAHGADMGTPGTGGDVYGADVGAPDAEGAG
ncbi:MAG: ATP-binding cassette domain-containing protein [Lachnospiraceae bacterium]|nr:ATP-binding cassette domain-containing protein [Lachnospiraceae bacterium]